MTPIFLRVTLGSTVYNSNTFKGEYMKRGTKVTITHHETESVVGQQGVITAAHCVTGSIRYHVTTKTGLVYYCAVSQLKINN